MMKARAITLDSPLNRPSSRICEKDGCEAQGDFRAPKSTSELQNYYWFCLDHVREYNKAWDFYKGMSPEEIDASRISDITWNRPSWPLGGWRTILESLKFIDNPEGVESFLKEKTQAASLPNKTQQALTLLELSFPLTLETLKKQYKKLAKRHHPDLNPNDTRAEERLKEINEAYKVVKDYLKI